MPYSKRWHRGHRGQICAAIFCAKKGCTKSAIKSLLGEPYVIGTNLMNQIYNSAMKAMDSCASIQKQKLRSHLRSTFGISTLEADRLVSEYRAIKCACFELAGEIFANELDSSLFETRIFCQYPKLDDDLKKRWLDESMMAQFR